MTTTKTKYKTGDRVCTVAREGAKCATVGQMSFPIWTGGIYEAAARQYDGVLTWRRVDSFGGSRSGYRPSPTYIAELQDMAQHEWLDGVRHGMRCNPE